MVEIVGALEASSRPHAPGTVGLLQDFLNTYDVETDADQISTPAQLGSWLVAKGLLSRPRRVRADEHVRAVELRERLRDALEAITHGSDAPAAIARLDEIAATVPLRMRFAGGTRLEPATARGAPSLGRILAAVYDGLNEGGLERLKVCREETCRWAFYDTSRNHSGVWCSMAICGNRTKGRVYRRRHAAGR